MTMCCTSHALMVRIRLGVAISCAHTIIELAHMKHLFFYMKKAFLFKFLCEAYVNSVLASNIYIYIYIYTFTFLIPLLLAVLTPSLSLREPCIPST